MKGLNLTTKLTDHFSLEELTFSQTALRKGINNVPSSEVKKNLLLLAQNLEKVRSILMSPIRISSGYRSPELNKAIGGVSNSAHIDGYAADFTSPFGTPFAIVKKLKDAGIKCDQCIMEGGNIGGWVHISFAPAMRNKFLTAKFVNGKAIYSEFKE